MNQPRVLISNASSDSGLAAIQALARSGFEVSGFDVRRLPLGIHSRYLRASYLLDRSSGEAFQHAYVDLVQRLRPDVLLPLGSRSVQATCRRWDEVSSLTAVLVPHERAFFTAFHKPACLAECRRLGIPCPATYGLDEAAEILAGDPDGKTFVVKPASDVGGATGVRYVKDVPALRRSVALCEREFGEALIQEYVAGGADAMRTVVLLYTQDSQLAAALTTRKLRHWPPTGGSTALSVSTAEPNLIDLVTPFFQHWRWRGAAEVELKWDAVEGVFKVIEINPRFPAYLRFAIQCGVDLPTLAARLALGSNTTGELPVCAIGRTYLCPGLFVKSVSAEIRTRGSRAAAMYRAVRQLGGAALGVLDMFADPLPVLGRALVD
jgi:predicted ATP-grasp superfamily ATP-dependent carboligase